MHWIRSVLIFIATATTTCVSSAADNCSAHSNDGTAPDASDVLGLLQVRSVVTTRKAPAEGFRDLVFMHLPFNFGNTIEKMAMFPPSTGRLDDDKYIESMSGGKSFADSDVADVPSWPTVLSITKAGGEVWGHLNPDLQVTSNITKCPLYLTPPKYWPEDLLKKYIGKKHIFGILRDPYEKLVAQFRGAMPDYGGSMSSATLIACDVNTAVKNTLKKIVATGNTFIGGCANIPQSEFFDGPHGITIPVDNWRFPQSANEILQEHGYPWRIRKKDILHVGMCEDHWSADLDSETREMVRTVYAKDFELICRSFGHCDFSQDTCLQGVHHMCPYSNFSWDSEKEFYCPRPGVDMPNVRVRQECL